MSLIFHIFLLPSAYPFNLFLSVLTGSFNLFTLHFLIIKIVSIPMNRLFFSSFFILSCLSLSEVEALKPKKFSSEEAAESYLNYHYNLGSEYYNQEKWKEASREFEKVLYFFPCSEEAADASFYLGVSYFEMKEYDFANESFSNYLKASKQPPYFEEAIYYKFTIAELFKCGKKRRPFQMRYLPKWTSGQEMALTIYDEIIAAFPCHELTISSIYSKANLLSSLQLFRESIDAYQLLIRRFPKDELVPDCYLNITKNYWKQSRVDFQNPDILGLAELNIEKFKSEFPRDERVKECECIFAAIRENFAGGFYKLGRFYERTKKREAAIIYYKSAIEQYETTRVADLCRQRLACLEENSVIVCAESLEEAEEEQAECEEKFVESSFDFFDEVPIQDLEKEVENYEEPKNETNQVEKVKDTEEYQFPQEQAPLFPNQVPYFSEELPPEISQEIEAFDIPSEENEESLEEKEDSATFLHYSLTKKREQKHVAPSFY